MGVTVFRSPFARSESDIGHCIFFCLYNLWHIAKKSNSRIQRFIGLFKSVYFVEVHVNSTAKNLAYHSIFARIRENSFVSGIEKAK